MNCYTIKSIQSTR